MNPEIHVLLVSEQAAPNLLPALDPALKPLTAVLVVSAKMKGRAEDLEAVLAESGVRTMRVSLDDEHDFAKLESALIDFAAAHEGQRVALNVTGGTKLMALAAQTVANAAGWQVFYVDVDTDEAIWLGSEARRQPLTQQLRLRHYLRGYGFILDQRVARPQPNQRYNDLLQTLIVQMGSLEKPLSQLNWLAQQAEDRDSLDVAMSPEQLDSRSLEALLRNLEEAQILSLKREIITFAGNAERSFAKGGWLETYVFRTVSALTEELALRDKAMNVVVLDKNGVKNELDVAFLARNRLFVIECKTARMDKPEAPKANDALFKLSEVCRRVGGLGTRGMLASYRRLGDAERRLAAALRVEVVCGPGLARLDKRIKAWVRGGDRGHRRGNSGSGNLASD